MLLLTPMALKMTLMALNVAPMMALMALNVVKYYNEYELKKASNQKKKESRFLFINSLLML